MIKIASWNVNSVRARLPNLLDWLKHAAPDVVLLQEIKTVEEKFPALEIEELGYNLAVCGQKTYNGVAILSQRPLEDVTRGLPGDGEDAQARYIEAVVGGTVRVASIYLPNGNPVDSEKYPYKLDWMERLRGRIETVLAYQEVGVFGGDYNVCPSDDDVYDPAGWRDDALCREDSRNRFQAIVNLGLTDAFRALHSELGAYTFWDYQKGRWQRDEGLRIDHLLLTPQGADRLAACEIDKGPRGKEKASDHTPIWCELED